MRYGPITARQIAVDFVLAVFVIGVVAGIIGADFVEHPRQSDSVLKVTAAQLAREYVVDDVKADEKYTGRLVEVTGIIDDLTTDSYGRRIVELRGSNPVKSTIGHTPSMRP